jgi:hypothetical protein
MHQKYYGKSRKSSLEMPSNWSSFDGDLLGIALVLGLLVMVVVGLVLGDVFEIYHNGSSL